MPRRMPFLRRWAAAASAALWVAGVLTSSEPAAAQEAAPASDHGATEMSVAPYVGVGALVGVPVGLVGTALFCTLDDCDNFLAPQLLPFFLGGTLGSLIGANLGLLTADTVALLENRRISVLASVVNILVGGGLVALGISYTLESARTMEAAAPLIGVGTVQLGLGTWHLFAAPGERTGT